MLTSTQILLGTAAPAAIAAVVLSGLARRPAAAKIASAAGGVAVSLGYMAGQIGLRGVRPFPPNEASQWLPYLALAAVLVTAFDPASGGRQRALHRVGGVGVIVVGLLLLLRPRLTHAWSGLEAVAWIGALALAGVGLWAALGRVLTALPPPSGWGVLVLVAAGATAAIVSSGSLLLGLLAGALAAASTGAALVAIPTGVGFERRSAIAPTVLLGGLLLVAHFYSELPAPSALLLALAPLVPRLVPRALVARRGAGFGALVHGAAAAVPVATAVALAVAASPPLEAYY